MSVNTLMNNFCEFLIKDDWKFERDDAARRISLGVSLSCKLQSVRMVITFRDDSFLVTAVCPLKADEGVRPAAMEYITRANYGLRSGNFEMDLSDGEIGYKTYVDAAGLERVPFEVIRNSLLVPAAMFDRYGNGLAAILFGLSDPETEIRKAEED